MSARLILISLILVPVFCGALSVDAADKAQAVADSSNSGHWLIRVEEGASPEQVAASVGAEYVRPLRGVEGYHQIRFLTNLKSRPDDLSWREAAVRQLEESTEILAFEEDEIIYRYPKVFNPPDPRFPEQWHLENVGQSGGVPFSDIRVRPAWDDGLSGEGTVIAIVDEGTEFRHPDLISNWLVDFGYDYNDDDSDPSPLGADDRHGTAVAGISLAASNQIGGLGVAYRARLVPLRLIASGFQRGEEAEALSYFTDVVDIYNNSWGPSDDFGVRYVDTSQVLKSALASNTASGRGGLGNIYVWAAGNGGLNGDNSNYDGYNASPYTISVGALGDDNVKAGYSEPGANLLVVAPSRGRGAGILTTDNTGSLGYAVGDVYENFSGTSAATPVVSGVVALLLQKRPDLGWRDVQKILALTATPVDFSEEKWSRNGAGHWVSHDYGFGRVDAAAATSLAEGWPIMGPPVTGGASLSLNTFIPEGTTLTRFVNVDRSLRVQHVQVRVAINHSDWGDLSIILESPAGTQSVLAEPHANANASGSPDTWTYLSTHHLDESSNGNWKLLVTDEGDGGSGSLLSWSVDIWGTAFGEGENRPPVADDLLIESTSFPVEIDVFDGLSDPDGDALTVISVAQPQFGELEDLGNGRFLYTMGQTRSGTDLISVLVSDGRGGAARRLVQFLDPRPVGRNDIFPVRSGVEVELPVLHNDMDPDEDPMRIISLGGNFKGAASISDSGTILYRSPDGFSGVERIQYELTDDSDGQSSAWVTVVVQDQPDVALDFDGEDDYLLLPPTPDLDLTDKFTVEAWINPRDWGEYVTGFGRIFDRSNFIFFLNGFDHSFYNDRSLVAYFVLNDGTTTAANTISGAIELNKWQHVAITFDRSVPVPVQIFVDGVPQSVSYPITGSTSPRLPLSDMSREPLFMGESSSGARAFKGRMTEFRIWDRVLTSGQILSRNDVRLSGNEAGLRLFFPLSGTIAPEARSTGELKVSATIFEAERVPLVDPWEVFEDSYRILDDFGNGWWEDRILGTVFGDAYPWVFIPWLGWVYSGHDGIQSGYVLHSDFSDWGWIRTSSQHFPWFYRFKDDSWMWYFEGSSQSAWIYSLADEAWSSVDSGAAGI